MKKLIYMAVAAALCCSCSLEPGTGSERTREEMERYARIMFDGYVMGPAAIARQIIQGSEDPPGEVDIFDYNYVYTQENETEWHFTIKRHNDEGASHAVVKYHGMKDSQRHMFSVSTHAEENTTIHYTGGRTSVVKASMTLVPEEITVIHPRHPGTYDDLKDYWDRVYGDGEAVIDLYKDGEPVDRIRICLYEKESDIITSLDPVIVK